MKKAITVTMAAGLVMLLFSACQQEGDPQTYEEKKEKLSEYQNELVDLRHEMKKLESEIARIEEEKGIRESKKPVKMDVLTPHKFKHSIEVQGLVESDENVMVSSEVNGIATRIYVDLGDRVRKGDVIAKIDNETLKDQLEELKTAYELANDTYHKRKNLWDQGIGSEIEYLQAKNRKESLEKQISTLQGRISKYTIRAPITGKVDDVPVNQGEMVSPGMPVANIVSAARVKVVADVSEKYVSSIREGDSVSVYFPAIGLREDAIIHATGQVINKENRTFKIVIRIDNHQHELKPNLLAKISIYDFVENSALVIPTRLVHYQEDSTYVYKATVENGDTVARKVHVGIAFSSAEQSLIERGLSKGDILIVEGHDRVSDGDKIKPAR